MKRYLWVVEVFEDGEWVPSAWFGFTRSLARIEQAEFREQGADKTRIVKYVSER